MQTAVTVLTALALGFLLATAAPAEVADSAANGFTVKVSLSIQAAPEVVYAKFVRNIGDWWDSSHSFSGSSKNMSIEEKAGGCFCEKLPDGGGVRHMTVAYISPGKQLVLSGGLGPLQSLATAGSMTITFKAAEGGTKVEVTYAVGGYMPGGLNTLATPVDGVIQQQFTRLKNYAEHGDPAPKK